MSKQLLLKIRGIAKSFGKQQVLRDVNFELHSGMIAGIEGENGSGVVFLMLALVLYWQKMKINK